MTKRFKYYFILIIAFLTCSVNAQYTINDSALVKKTFDRKFKNSVFNQYLTSSDPLRVNAGLLSVSQSGEKSFIGNITNLNFSKNAEYICFALGQLGPDSISTTYLTQKLSDPNLPVKYVSYILKAIGKTGFKETLEQLENDYSSNDYLMYDGISIALYDFYSRGIKDDPNFARILGNELTAKDIPLYRKIEAAFAVYRTNLNDTFKDVITNDLYYFSDNNNFSSDKGPLIQYYLECLRKSKYFPENSTLFESLLKINSVLLRTEAAKVLVYYDFQDEDNISNYLSLLDDDNPDVSRQAAISIKDIAIPDTFKSYFKNELLKRINRNNGAENTKGELCISYLKLFPESFSDILKTFSSKVNMEFLFRIASSFPESDSAFSYLIQNFKNSTVKDKADILELLIKFQPAFGNNSELINLFFSSISSESPALISIASDGIDSSLIINNEDSLTQIISDQTLKYLNDPNFTESLISLNSLANKIGSEIYNQNLQDLSNSNIYAIRSFAKRILKLPVENSTDTDSLFSDIWANSFKYKIAEVVTNKGSFRINLLPEYAPVTVGNFCYLARKKFFDNIIFHRVVPGFVIQGGDPTGTGWGGPGYAIVSEFSNLHYSPGTVGMASSGKNTEGSQWFVTIGDFPHLDRHYTIFGFVVDGMDVVNAIDQNDKIITVNLSY